jgi:hypothetical protein
VGYVKLVHPNIMPPFLGYKWDPENDQRLKRFGQGIADLLAQHGAADQPLAIDMLDGASVLALLDADVRVVDGGPSTAASASSTRTPCPQSATPYAPASPRTSLPASWSPPGTSAAARRCSSSTSAPART